MITDKERKDMHQFYRAVLALEDEEECRKFFDDVATIKEVIDLSARFEVARMLDSGAGSMLPASASGVTIRLISGIARALANGLASDTCENSSMVSGTSPIVTAYWVRTPSASMLQ